MHFLTSKLSWRDFDILACICTLLISTESLILIYFIITRRCAEIFLIGDDCGVGIGWFCIAAGLVGTGMYAGWMLYRLTCRRDRPG
ncbi:MAG: hypothetical protein WC379_08340 [Methanoregula sp.]